MHIKYETPNSLGSDDSEQNNKLQGMQNYLQPLIYKSGSLSSVFLPVPSTAAHVVWSC